MQDVSLETVRPFVELVLKRKWFRYRPKRAVNAIRHERMLELTQNSRTRPPYLGD